MLEVLRLVKEEMELRDLTRAAEQARAAVTALVNEEQCLALAETQTDLGRRARGVTADLMAKQIDEGKDFQKEIDQINQAAAAMEDAARLLRECDTGAPTIAAETEAIEALLRTRKVKPGGGGGGGSSPGGGGAVVQSELEASALERLGAGVAATPRDVHQATGVSGDGVPEEFRRGLDAYFNALERGAQR